MLFHRLWSAFKFLNSFKVIADAALSFLLTIADSHKQKSYQNNSMEEYPLEYKFLYALKVCSKINVAELARLVFFILLISYKCTLSFNLYISRIQNPDELLFTDHVHEVSNKCKRPNQRGYNINFLRQNGKDKK